MFHELFYQPYNRLNLHLQVAKSVAKFSETGVEEAGSCS